MILRFDHRMFVVLFLNMKEEYICVMISVRVKTTFIVGSMRERTISYLKTKKKGMQKMNKKTEEKYGVDKRLCNATHE